MPSEASVKFFGEAFFQKSFDLALDLSGRQPEKKLGKQPGNLWLPAPFPDGGVPPLSIRALGRRLNAAPVRATNARARRGQLTLSVMPKA